MEKFMQNPIVQWVEYRLPVISFMNHQLVDYPTPRNLNYWWNFGSLAGIALVIQIVTGIVLAFHYTPQADLAAVYSCVIIRGPGWQKDTLPAPLIKTGIFNAGHARGSFGGCIEGEELDP